MFRVLCAAFGAALLVGCATSGTGYGSGRNVEVIAHRGASAYAPENTLAAFQLADEMDAEWFELDCTLTKDGEVIVIHDDDTERTTGKIGKVKDQTLAELKTLDAGSWKAAEFAGETLPTLAETLDLAKGKIGVYIEIKNSADDGVLIAEVLNALHDHTVANSVQRKEIMELIERRGSRNLELTRKVIELVRARGMENEIVIQSFAPIVCTVAAIEAPELRTELLAFQDEEKNPGYWEMYLRYLYLFDLDGLNTNANTLTEGRLAAIHAAGKTVAIWTVNDEAEMRKYIKWGIDRIITDRPDVAKKVIASN